VVGDEGEEIYRALSKAFIVYIIFFDTRPRRGQKQGFVGAGVDEIGSSGIPFQLIILLVTLHYYLQHVKHS